MNRIYLLKKIGAELPPEKLVVADQDAYDIIARMLYKHKKCAADYDRIAGDFNQGSTLDICHRLWAFCRTNITYREETIDKQDVSSPQTILKRGYCDCKGYALMIGGIIDALNRQGRNIKWFYRFASDDLFNSIPGHVFVVVMDAGSEIWVDPVLSTFNQDHYFPYYEDRRVSVRSAVIAGCCMPGAIGSDFNKATGAAIMKLAPALSAVPVAAIALEVVGLALTLFGDSFIYSSDVRGLIQKYQYFVLGDASVNEASKANEALKDQAQTWFALVFGVPIYDDLRYDALRGEDHDTFSDLPNRWNYPARILKYKSFGPVESAVPDSVVMQACVIADSLDDRTKGAYPTAPGAWAGALPASSVISKAGEQPNMYIDANGNLVTPTTGRNKFFLIAAAAVIAFILIKK